VAFMSRDLSIVIPVYNGENFIGETLHQIHSYLEKATNFSFEIIAVNDGSTDSSLKVLQSLDLPFLTVLDCAVNRGKFAAIRRGMAYATGRCRIFTDADLPYDLEAFPYMTHLVNGRGLHVVVGDRNLLHSEYAERLTPIRAVCTHLFTLFVRLLVVSGLHDTQCGLKAFRGELADELFPLVKDDGFSGDVELLYLALKYNLEIKRIPVRLRRSGASSVRVLKHGIMMLRRILQLRLAWSRGDYESQKLRELVDQQYWKSPIPRITQASSVNRRDSFANESGLLSD
jgi:dolichyl-phosphate beta-glucosyltransferase